jgi:hypothetical protein
MDRASKSLNRLPAPREQLRFKILGNLAIFGNFWIIDYMLLDSRVCRQFVNPLFKY